MRQLLHRRWLRSMIMCIAVLGVAAPTIAQTETYNGYPVVRVTVKDKPLTATVPPIIIENITMVPLRAIVEALGLSVKWDDTTRRVVVADSVQPKPLPAQPSTDSVGSESDPSKPEIIEQLKASLAEVQSERDKLQDTIDTVSRSKEDWVNTAQKLVADRAQLEAELSKSELNLEATVARERALQAQLQAVQTENRRLSARVEGLQATLAAVGTSSPAPHTAQLVPSAASERGITVTVLDVEQINQGLALEMEIFNTSTRPVIVLQNLFRIVAGAQEYPPQLVDMLGDMGNVPGGELNPGATRKGRVVFPGVPKGTTAIRLLLKFGSEATTSPYIVSMNGGPVLRLYTISEPWEMNMTLRVTK